MFIIRTVILWVIISTIINAYLMTLPKSLFSKHRTDSLWIYIARPRFTRKMRIQCFPLSLHTKMTE